MALKSACAVWSSGNTVCGERRGEGQERRFVRMYGAGKLQSFVAEVDDDAGRAGCFTERQPRRGLAGDGETPETSASKDPCERTPIANERAQVSSLHAQTHPRGVVRRSRGPFTHLCRAERECKSAKRALSPAQTTVLSFRCWSERKVVLDRL